jgi:hypothetical protein
LSRGSIAALAAYIVVSAALLLYARRRGLDHPGLVLAELLGFPLLVALASILARRRRRGVG